MLETGSRRQKWPLHSDRVSPDRGKGGVAAVERWLSVDARQPSALVWTPAPERPLDSGGPIERPFDRMGPDFASRPAAEHLAAVATKYPNKIAVSDGAQRFTCAEFAARVASLARLIATAVPEDRAVGLLLQHSVWYPLAMLACMAAGRPCVPLNLRDPMPRIADVARDARLSALVVAGAEGPRDWTEMPDVRWIDATAALNDRPDPPAALPLVSVDAPAVVLYTSGSTGRPKGVINGQRSLLQRVQQYVDACHINADDVFLPLSGPTTIAGCREMLTAVLTGATLHLADVETVGIRGIRRQIRAHGVTMMYFVPALLRAVLAGAEDGDFASLRNARIGGEKVLWTDIALVRRALPASCFVQVGYSSTETTGSQWFLPNDWPEQGPSTPAGYPLPGISFAVIDDAGRAVAAGQIGELLIKSRYVLLGYWENGETVPMPVDPCDPRERIFATGDLVIAGERSLLQVVGRKGRQIKINGRRVEPAELELAVHRVPTVEDAVFVVTEANELVVFAVPHVGAGASFKSDVRDAVRRTLPTALQPTRLHDIPEIPRLPGGKVDSARLRELDRMSRAGAEAPRANVREAAQIKETVERVWKEILGTPVARGRWDEAGGDSLKLLRCVMELEEAIGRELGLEAFTVDMSFVDMVDAAVRRAREAPASASAESRPRLFLLPGSMGYGPSLAAFGAEMGRAAQVTSIRYPDLVAILAGRATVKDMAESALEQIKLAQPHGDVRLLGYSLGGAVAFEVAARLIAEGRSVKFFGILDTSVGPMEAAYRETFLRALQRIRAHRVTAYRMLCRSTAKVVARRGWEASFAGLLEAGVWTRLAATRFMLRLELEEILRMRAFTRWVGQHKAQLPITGTLFLCSRVGAPFDLGWRQLFARLDVIPIAGGHLDLVVEPHLAINRSLIERALVATYT